MRFILYSVALLFFSALPAVAANADITDLQVISLQDGITDVPHLAPDGRDGEILKTWRTNGDARGYDLFLVMLDKKVIGVATDNGFQDTVTDAPRTHLDAVKSVRFAWGKVAGEKHALLITATRTIESGYGPTDPATTVFDIYQIMPNGPLGTTGDYFARISEFSSKQKYCNSDIALSQNLGLPLPDPYEGRGLPDGCL
jgi:hypothetical protein